MENPPQQKRVTMENLKSVNVFPHVHRFDVDTNLTGVQLPSEARFLEIGRKTKPFILYKTEGRMAEPPPTHKAFIPAGNLLPVRLGVGMQRAKTIYVSTKTGTGKAVVILSE